MRLVDRTPTMSTCDKCGEEIQEQVRCSRCLGFDEERFKRAVDRLYDHFEVESSDAIPLGVKQYREKIRLLYPRVEERARARTTCYYNDIYGDGLFSAWLGRMLGTIGHIEEEDGRPALTSVVVDSDREFPDEGYFDMIEAFPNRPDDITSWSEAEKQDWWADELAGVYEFWDHR
jgi:hypothetical protein